MLENIVAALRARCPRFAGRVGSAAQFTTLPGEASSLLPAAYVLPLGDTPGSAMTSTGYRQFLRDSFDIVVALDNGADPSGATASFDAMGLVRPELFRALLGWEPDADHGPLTYEGCQLQDMNQTVLWYRFRFGADSIIELADTYAGAVLDDAPAFETTIITFGEVSSEDPSLGPVDATGRPVPGISITL